MEKLVKLKKDIYILNPHCLVELWDYDFSKSDQDNFASMIEAETLNFDISLIINNSLINCNNSNG